MKWERGYWGLLSLIQLIPSTPPRRLILSKRSASPEGMPSAEGWRCGFASRSEGIPSGKGSLWDR